MSTPIVRRRKKPIEVDTIQWLGDNETAVQNFTGGPAFFFALTPEDREGCDDPEATATVFDRLHSTWILVYTGQHIVRGIKGELYPIAEDVLTETYELATGPASADLLPKADVVAWLVKKAREGTPVWLLASKVERGAIRPDNLRMLPATFFEAGRTYEYAPLHLLFRCDAVGAHPVTGEPSAVGWVRYHGGGWSSGDYSPSEYSDGWTDITDTTEAGEGQ